MGLIQRVVEAAGIPTVSMSINRVITEKVKPPRALFVDWPFGHPMGAPGNTEQQMTVLKQALRALVTLEVPGTIVDLPYLWSQRDFQGLAAAVRYDSPF